VVGYFSKLIGCQGVFMLAGKVAEQMPNEDCILDRGKEVSFAMTRTTELSFKRTF
jgi:hypothetical protein